MTVNNSGHLHFRRVVPMPWAMYDVEIIIRNIKQEVRRVS
jgi:hypothetical protein